MARFAVRGARLCVPAILDRQTIVFRELAEGAPLVDTGFGTVGPGANAAILDPEIMLVPLSAFDISGHRIGYGAKPLRPRHQPTKAKRPASEADRHCIRLPGSGTCAR